MKIVVPLTNIEDYEELINYGANEFYCGYIPLEWLKKYNIIYPLNRREKFAQKINICDITSINILSKKIQKEKIPVKITFNALYYSEDNYKLIEKYINELMEYGFDTFIIADFGLIYWLRLKNNPCKIHVSGELGYANSLSFNYLNNFNINRNIFPRKTSIEEMQQCIKANERELEYEAFVLNELCPYSGAMCNTMHYETHVNFCNIRSELIKKNELNNETGKTIKYINKFEKLFKIQKTNNTLPNIGFTGCGLCKIKELHNVGIRYVKIVGRGVNTDAIKNDIAIVKDICNHIYLHDDDFRKYIINTYFENNCSQLCYYK